jgi:GDP-L-fucose synthase
MTTLPPPSKIILVTGSTGLVGHGVQKAVQVEPGQDEKWIMLSSKDGDLRIYEDCVKIFETYRPTHCLHLAAFVGGLFRNIRMKTEFFNYNMAMNMNVLSCCEKFNVRKVVSCLSTCIFPDNIEYPISESSLHDGPPHPSNEGYAYAKRMVDVMNRGYTAKTGCVYTSVIPTNIYGPYDNFELEDSHVIPGLIHKCYLSKQENKDFVIWGSGKPLRQFVYSEDLGKLMVWAIRSYDECSPIILSVDPQNEVSIEKVARSIAAAMNYTGSIKFDTGKQDGQFKKTVDNSKLRSRMPNFTFTGIDVGIKKTVAWFVENYATVRK